MRALVLLCISQYTEFEVPRFTNYKDVIGAKLKKTADHAPFRGGLSP